MNYCLFLVCLYFVSCLSTESNLIAPYKYDCYLISNHFMILIDFFFSEKLEEAEVMVFATVSGAMYGVDKITGNLNLSNISTVLKWIFA